jgi:hypothetical protein
MRETKDQLQNLIRRIGALSDDDQAEILRSLVEMRGSHLGIYEFDDIARPAR